MKPDRWLATVLFTDIVGSTEKAAELGDRAWRELLQAHHALARRELARFGGRELNTTGDGFLATFEVPERALRCAVAIREAVRRVGLEIRSGVHTGEVEVVEKTVGGLAVHIGARVAALAGPGEVLVSSTTRDLVAGSGFEFEDRGSHALKGVPGEWRLYSVTSAPVRLPMRSFWTRVREARLPRVVVLYLVACAGVLWLTVFLHDRFQLPPWVIPLAVVLLLIGLVVLAATAWVQAHPLTVARAEREELPGSWELDLADMGRSVARGRVPHLTWSRAILGGVFAFSMLFGLAGVYVLVQDRGRSLGPPEAQAGPGPALAVLPFRVIGEEADLWREGMVDLLSTNLDGAAGVRTIDPRVVLARWHRQVGEGAEITPPEGLRVAREVGARHALIGSMVALGGEVRLSAQIYDVRTGRMESETQVRGSPDSVPGLVDRLSLEVLRAAVAEEGAPGPRLALRQVTSASIPALKAYLTGEQAYRRSHWEEAIGHFTRAFEADTSFALAVYRIANAYGWLEGPTPRTVEHFERAGRLADRLPEREALLLKGNAGFSLENIRILERLTSRYPDDVEGWYALGDLSFHGSGFLLYPFERFREAFQRALTLDPSFGPAYIHLIQDAFARQDSASARRLIEGYRLIDPMGTQAAGFALAYALAWGGETSRSAARAAVDTASTEVLLDVLTPLRYSREAWQESIQLSRALAARPLPVGALARERYLLSIPLIQMNQGHLNDMRDALLSLSEQGGSRAIAFRLLLAWQLAGYPAGPSSGRAVEVLGQDPEPLDRLLLGALAANEQRWEDVEHQIEALRTRPPAGEQPAEALLPLDQEAAADALRAYAAARRRDGRGAIADLQRALSSLTVYCPTSDACLVHGMLRYQLGKMLLEWGSLREAELYLKSVELYYGLAPAEFYLGKVYEASGDLEQAKHHYEEFVRWWQDCDPELKPLLDEGRQALARLKGMQRL